MPGEWRPLAGGTDLMVLFAAGKLKHRRFLNIWNLRELCGIIMGTDAVTLGALVTYSDVLRHPKLRLEFPLLAAAAEVTGSIATQNRGTLGGNIVHASPAADTPPALLVYNTEVELISVRGSRWVPYCRFHTGYKQVRMQPDELLTRIRIFREHTRCRSRFRKVGARRAQAIAKLSFAGIRDLEKNEVRLAFGSVAPTPLRCFRTEAAVRDHGDPIAVLATELAPISDIRSTADYRLTVAQTLLREFLNDAG